MKHNLIQMIKYSFYPIIILGSIYSNLLLFNIIPESQTPIISLIISFVVIIIIILLEFTLPFKRQWIKNQGDLKVDLIQTNIILPISSKIGEISIFAFFLAFSSSSKFTNILNSYPLLIQLIVITIIAEFFYYWIHRFLHTSDLLWPYHSVHHGAKRVYWGNSGRFHPLESIISTFVYLSPLAFFNVNIKVLTLFYTLTAITGLLEHVNIDFKGRYLNYIFNTAHLHRWHHSIRRDQHDNNFGKILSIWDLLFNTWLLPKNEVIQDVGISNHEIPNTLQGQFLYPFIKDKKIKIK